MARKSKKKSVEPIEEIKEVEKPSVKKTKKNVNKTVDVKIDEPIVLKPVEKPIEKPPVISRIGLPFINIKKITDMPDVKRGRKRAKVDVIPPPPKDEVIEVKQQELPPPPKIIPLKYKEIPKPIIVATPIDIPHPKVIPLQQPIIPPEFLIKVKPEPVVAPPTLQPVPQPVSQPDSRIIQVVSSTTNKKIIVDTQRKVCYQTSRDSDLYVKKGRIPVKYVTDSNMRTYALRMGYVYNMYTLDSTNLRLRVIT